MPTCRVCGKAASATPLYAKGHYCQAHFRRLLYRRVRKDLRRQGFIPAKTCRVVDDGTSKAALVKEVIGVLFKDAVRFVEHDAQQLLLACCLEEDVSERFSLFLRKESMRVEGFRPLRTLCVSDLEALMPHCALRRDDLLHPLLRDLEKVQPSALFAASRMLKG